VSAPTGFPPKTRDGILSRDGERCAMQGHPRCRGGRATEANHRLNRGQGGDPRELVNSPANGAAAEHSCNWLLEVNADFAEEGRRRGVKLAHSGDDEAQILSTPMWSVFWSQWIVLRATACYLTGDRDGTGDARTARVVGSELVGFTILWNVPAAANNPANQTTGAVA
jgi:hypothetical protein